jgi:hypothetical protein
VFTKVNQNVGMSNIPDINVSRVGSQQLPLSRSNFYGNNLDFTIKTDATDSYSIMYRNSYDVTLLDLPEGSV